MYIYTWATRNDEKKQKTKKMPVFCC